MHALAQLCVRRPVFATMLANGIAGAALDVYESEPIDMADPLLGLENCVLIPHIGASSLATERRQSGVRSGFWKWQEPTPHANSICCSALPRRCWRETNRLVPW